MTRPLISIVVPVYKAEECLEELYRRLNHTLETISSFYEIIFVEDCGGDRSWEIIQNLARLDARVRGVQFSRNFGQHCGITAGLDICLGDWVVVMDCDLQDRPEEITRLYHKALEGYDVVLARRQFRKDSFFKRITSWLFYKTFSYLTDMKYDGSVGNFRIISRQVVDNLLGLREQLRFFGGLVQWVGFHTTFVDVDHSERYAGKSSYTLSKLLKLATGNIIAFSDKPLWLVVRVGFLMAFFAFGFGAYIFIEALTTGAPIAGWPSLIVSLYFIGGIIIFILGVLGIYLGRTFDQTKSRPLYIIRESTDQFIHELAVTCSLTKSGRN